MISEGVKLSNLVFCVSLDFFSLPLHLEEFSYFSCVWSLTVPLGCGYSRGIRQGHRV